MDMKRPEYYYCCAFLDSVFPVQLNTFSDPKIMKIISDDFLSLCLF